MENHCSSSSASLPILFLLIFISFFIFLFLSDLTNPVSITQFQFQTQIVTSSQEVRAVLSGNSTSKAPTIVRKIGKLSELGELEEGLARARSAIREEATSGNVSLPPLMVGGQGQDEIPSGEIHRNSAAFHQSYLEMEKRFKVFVYKEGEPPLVHDGPCKNIYTSEGRFIHELELGQTQFRTMDPNKAHVYFMPFSVTMLVTFLYQPNSPDRSALRLFVADYVRVISSKYGFWNRSQGADHFMLSCHDWGPYATLANPNLYNNSIRVLCNANTSEGFNPSKDVSLPEINLLTGEISPKLLTAPPDTAPRPYLAFFAGGLHGPIRPILLRHWKGMDNDVQVYERLPKGLDYYSFMLMSKFCLCPSGYEVASPRIVEAIYAECVPVIISDHYVLPFSDVFRWEKFSVEIAVVDIPRLKQLLREVPEEKYRRLKEGVKAVKRHFMLNRPAKRFDMFHMILHSIWLRRLNIKLA